MEKGIKTLQTTARTAQRKASADQNQAFCEDRGISDHNSDSGVVLCSGSEPDVEVDESETAPPSRHGHGASASWSESYSRQQERLHQEHMRSRSLPLPLPQYQPPAPRAPKAYGHEVTGPVYATNLGAISYDRPTYTSHEPSQRYSPETQQRLSIQSVLIPEEPGGGRFTS
jgi:hypothetical protein